MPKKRRKIEIKKLEVAIDAPKPKRWAEVVVPVPLAGREKNRRAHQEAAAQSLQVGILVRAKGLCSWCGQIHFEYYEVHSREMKLSICKFCLLPGGDALIGALQGGIPGLGKSQ